MMPGLHLESSVHRAVARRVAPPPAPTQQFRRRQAHRSVIALHPLSAVAQPHAAEAWLPLLAAGGVP
jgi:hypothetical protein